MKEIERPQPKATEPAQPQLSAWRDELNFAEWPLALLTDRPSADQKTVTFRDLTHQDGKPIERQLTITGSDAYGLPTPLDQDVLLATLELTRRKTGFARSTVSFTCYELLNLLDWHDKGQNFERLRESLKRWGTASYVYERAWWNNDKEEWERLKIFHILDDVDLNRHAPSSITWSKVVFNSLRAGHVRALDWHFYTSLRLDGSKRAYRFLSKRFWRRSELEFELREFACDKIGFSRNYHNGELKRKLNPILTELEDRKFLKPQSPIERYPKVARGQWKVRIQRSARALRDLRETRENSAAPDPTPSPLAAELLSRNVTEATATQLVESFPVEHITLQLEVFDWLKANADKRLSRNPAGWLVQAIKNNYTPPAGFETKAQRDQRLAAEQTKVAATREAADHREHQEGAARERQLAPILAYLATRTPEEIERLQAEAILAADAFHRRQAQRPESDLVRAIRQKLLHEHVARFLAQTPAPSLEPVHPPQ